MVQQGCSGNPDFTSDVMVVQGCRYRDVVDLGDDGTAGCCRQSRHVSVRVEMVPVGTKVEFPTLCR